MLSNTNKLQTGVTLAAVTAARQTSESRGARAAWPGIAEFWRPPELVRLVEPSSYVHGVFCTSVNIPTGTCCWAGSSSCRCFSCWWVGRTAPLIPTSIFSGTAAALTSLAKGALSRCPLLPAPPGHSRHEGRTDALQVCDNRFKNECVQDGCSLKAWHFISSPPYCAESGKGVRAWIQAFSTDMKLGQFIILKYAGD